MWVWSGFVLSLALAGVAWWRSVARVQTFYESELYGTGAGAHRKYALGFTVAAAVFLAELVRPGLLRTPFPWWPEAFLGLVVLTGITYASGFLRGATGEDE